jgi:hypothetical protein
LHWPKWSYPLVEKLSICTTKIWSTVNTKKETNQYACFPRYPWLKPWSLVRQKKWKPIFFFFLLKKTVFFTTRIVWSHS